MEEKDIREEVLDNKGEIRMGELRLQALINLLSKEGVITKDEIEEELNNLLALDKEEP